jgi:hypothetical protein
VPDVEAVETQGVLRQANLLHVGGTPLDGHHIRAPAGELNREQALEGP